MQAGTSRARDACLEFSRLESLSMRPRLSISAHLYDEAQTTCLEHRSEGSKTPAKRQLFAPGGSAETFRQEIEERSDGRHHAAPRWEHSVHYTRSRAQRWQQPNQRAARQVPCNEQRRQARHTNATNGCQAQGIQVIGAKARRMYQ